MNTPALCPLDDLGVLRFAGPDARKFLQGQLSSDVLALTGGDTRLRAGLHTPQGRTLAVLLLAAASEEVLLAILPQELLATVAATLKRYVLRARVAVSDASADYRLLGLSGSLPAPLTAGALLLPYEGERQLVVAERAAACLPGAPMARSAWRALDIAAGLPQMYLPTSGQFIAQMLNLDCIGAISFTKGCYTGQEVIARAHYRGRVKRRMQRFLSDAPLQLAPGDAARLPDGRSLRVIEAQAREDGRLEFLAVAPLGESGQTDDGTPAGRSSDDEGSGDNRSADGGRIEARALPLPYEWPE